MREPNPFASETIKIIESRPQKSIDEANPKAISIFADANNLYAKPAAEEIDILLQSIPNPDAIALIEIAYDSNLTRIPDLSRFNNIQYAHIGGRKIKNYDQLYSKQKLYSLLLINYKECDLCQFPELNLKNFRAIRGSIEKLELGADFALIQACSKLASVGKSSIRFLILESCNNIDLRSLKNIGKLETLQLLGSKSLTSLEFVKDCKYLKSLTITATPVGKLDFDFLKQNKSLE